MATPPDEPVRVLHHLTLHSLFLTEGPNAWGGTIEVAPLIPDSPETITHWTVGDQITGPIHWGNVRAAPFDWRLQVMDLHTATMDLSAVLEHIDRYCQQVGHNPIVDEIQAIMRGERPTAEDLAETMNEIQRKHSDQPD